MAAGRLCEQYGKHWQLAMLVDGCMMQALVQHLLLAQAKGSKTENFCSLTGSTTTDICCTLHT